MTDEALVRLFEAGEVPPDGFHHRDHVRVAWWYLRRSPWRQALDRFIHGLRLFAGARGRPELYHETITTAYFLLIAECVEESGRELSWEEFAARHPDLLSWQPSILDRYYRPATLASERAKRMFVMPDRLEP
jgi:hypothetical protein